MYSFLSDYDSHAASSKVDKLMTPPKLGAELRKNKGRAARKRDALLLFTIIYLPSKHFVMIWAYRVLLCLCVAGCNEVTKHKPQSTLVEADLLSEVARFRPSSSSCALAEKNGSSRLAASPLFTWCCLMFTRDV